MTSQTQPVPFSAGVLWAEQGWALLRRRPLFFGIATLTVLGLRWLLDLMPVDGASALVIVLSYLTDALVVATVWAAQERAGGGGLWAGWTALSGRRWRVAVAGLWGLTSAALGFVLLSLALPLMQPVGVALGARVAGWAMLGWVFLSGAASCLLLFGALLAAIETARGENNLWTAGRRGMRAATRGWRPLLALWTAFVCGATLCALATAAILGHLSLDALDGPARAVLEYWINWPALFVAVLVLLAVIGPAARHLTAAAHHAEVAAPPPGVFGERVARWLGLVLTILAAAFVLAGMFAVDLSLDLCLLGGAGLATTGWALSRSAPAWRQAHATFWARWNWIAAAALWAVVVVAATR